MYDGTLASIIDDHWGLPFFVFSFDQLRGRVKVRGRAPDTVRDMQGELWGMQVAVTRHGRMIAAGDAEKDCRGIKERGYARDGDNERRMEKGKTRKIMEKPFILAYAGRNRLS